MDTRRGHKAWNYLDVLEHLRKVGHYDHLLCFQHKRLLPLERCIEDAPAALGTFLSNWVPLTIVHGALRHQAAPPQPPAKLAGLVAELYVLVVRVELEGSKPSELPDNASVLTYTSHLSIRSYDKYACESSYDRYAGASYVDRCI